MRLLAHCDPESAEPLGVWTLPTTGLPALHYIDEEALAYAQARIGDLPGTVDWEAQATQMAESSPYVAWWGVVEVAAESLDDALTQLRQEWVGVDAEPGSSRFEAAARRLRFAARARHLAEQVLGGPTVEHDPGFRVSKTLVLRRSPDNKHLVVLVGADESPGDIDAAMAYGLSFQGDRDLHLVLPEDRREVRGLGAITGWEPTSLRLAHVVTPVHLWSHDGAGTARQRRIATKHESLRASRLDDVLPVTLHDLGERRTLVDELLDWADREPSLEPAHRSTYLAWHSHGRQVLKILRSAARIRITAGVDYSEHRVDHVPPVVIEISDPVSPSDLVAIQESVLRAVAERAAGADTENLEHQLQARLAQPGGVDTLGLVGHLERELPATRPGQRRAFVDLVGVDSTGNLHLIETKLGLDVMLALQGLDYWVWLTEHSNEIAALLRERGHEVADEPRLFLDFVVGTKEDDGRRPDLRYFAGQAEVLDGEISWRVGIVSGWRDPASAVEIEWARRRVTPDEPNRPESPRFARRLEDHLQAWADANGLLERSVFLKEVESATIPPARPALRRLVDAGLGHRFLRHVRSSQLFAVNLFGGLTAEQATAVARLIDPTVISAELPVLEYIDPLDRLRERTAGSPHTTQIDVMIRAHTGEGAIHLLVIEVKLSEDDFGGCSAYQHAANDRLDLCATPAPFGGDPAGCFQLRNKGAGHPRTYDKWLTGLDAVTEGPGCPFRATGNQPMRNVALASSLLASGEADRATFVLCAHDDHQVIWRRWADAQVHLAGTDVGFAELPASQMLLQLSPADAATLAAQYGLPSTADDNERLLAALSWSRTVLQRVAGEGSVLEQLEVLAAPGPIPSAANSPTARRLAQRLEALAELARSTREAVVPPVLTPAEIDESVDRQ